jgi:pimeloyl-ACP methyl ester carboxylesterase
MTAQSAQKLHAADRLIQRREVQIPSQGKKLAASLYEPDLLGQQGKVLRPAIVMAHGLSLTRDCGLQRYAESFAAAGFTVLVFDYRGFGDSEGDVRELVSVKMQVEDYRSALAFVRKLPGVDQTRIGLWGTSYSGGIATQCAHEDGQVQALVIQVPNLDNVATGLYMTRHLMMTAPLRGLWLVAMGLADFAASLIGAGPVYVTCMGRGQSWAAYVNDESMDQIEQIQGPQWRNRLAPRDFVRWPFRPVRHMASLKCAIQLFAADRDDLTPSSPALRAAKMAGDRAELHRYPVGHFGVYVGAVQDEIIEKQTRFFVKKLGMQGR